MARGPWRWCPTPRSSRSFFFNDTATTEIYTLSLHDALPISLELDAARARSRRRRDGRAHHAAAAGPGELHGDRDRSEEHTSELQSLAYLVCRLLLEKKNRHA